MRTQTVRAKNLEWRFHIYKNLRRQILFFNISYPTKRNKQNKENLDRIGFVFRVSLRLSFVSDSIIQKKRKKINENNSDYLINYCIEKDIEQEIYLQIPERKRKIDYVGKKILSGFTEISRMEQDDVDGKKHVLHEWLTMISF